MHIILLSGWAESGKDTCADYLSKKGYKRLAFADVLKKKCAADTKFPYELTQTHEGKSSIFRDRSVRQHLIDYANIELKKNTYAFVEDVVINIEFHGYEKVVISDWRRMDELIGLQKFLPNAKITPIHIQRHLVSPIADSTEYQLSFPFRYRIENYGSLEDFYEAIDKVYNSL
jgi:hypothetical protein